MTSGLTNRKGEGGGGDIQTDRRIHKRVSCRVATVKIFVNFQNPNMNKL